jgi:predicted dehydrogenase
MSNSSLIRVGVLTCARYVHISGIWGPIIDPTSEVKFQTCTTRMTGMVMTHVWDMDKEGAQKFTQDYKGVEAVDNYWDMVGKVDGIILSDFDSCLHFKELTKPYLEAGVPIFINRPFALNLADAQEMIDLSKKYDTPIMSGSSFEFAPEIEQIKSQVAAVGPVRGFTAANSMSDYATHGIHGVLCMHACIGGGIRSMAYQTPDWHTPNGLITFEYEPRGEDGKVFYGSLQEISGTWGWIRVFGERSFEQFIQPGIHFWVPSLLVMQEMFETRVMPQSHEAIYEKTQMFLAAFKSHMECGGAPVALDDIGDWQAPLLNADPYPDGYFG